MGPAFRPPALPLTQASSDPKTRLLATRFLVGANPGRYAAFYMIPVNHPMLAYAQPVKSREIVGQGPDVPPPVGQAQDGLFQVATRLGSQRALVIPNLGGYDDLSRQGMKPDGTLPFRILTPSVPA